MLTYGRHGVYLPFFPALMLSCVCLAFDVSFRRQLKLSQSSCGWLSHKWGRAREIWCQTAKSPPGQRGWITHRGFLGFFWSDLFDRIITFCSSFVLEETIKDTIYTFMLRTIETFRKHERLGKFSRARRGSVGERGRWWCAIQFLG